MVYGKGGWDEARMTKDADVAVRVHVEGYTWQDALWKDGEGTGWVGRIFSGLGCCYGHVADDTGCWQLITNSKQQCGWLLNGGPVFRDIQVIISFNGGGVRCKAAALVF